MKSSPQEHSVTDRKRSRTIARVAAVQALYQCEHNKTGAEPVLKEFASFRHVVPNADFADGHIPNADLSLLNKIVRQVLAEQSLIDDAIKALLPTNWPLERLDPVLRSLLRAAIYELQAGTPKEIIINEYLDVAHGFFSGDEPKMVNGILDSYKRQDGNIS
ncbi:transcription antitermination factor NusB [Aristophania vespae]|uniref:Transcription antitermination protein NusB n=1 Tax=Aristophania vespae TaxID=2697033 RepID=A0A6P1NAX4_9PROT|nr:transcription antitermination factor NusB [Aristophania vespae]QHI95546.1 transcription antitermination factor NusB [Aristophania vespae]UMM63202.1 Transcription antitermination protein NusB [Aristophania vespae]